MYIVSGGDPAYIKSKCLDTDSDENLKKECLDFDSAKRLFKSFINTIDLSNIELTYIQSYDYSHIPQDLVSVLPTTSQGIMLRKE